MYRLSKKRELFISKDRKMLTMKNYQTLEDVSLPIECWDKIAAHMKEVDEHIIPRLAEGLKVNFDVDIGSNWRMYIRTAFQAVTVRPRAWKIDTRRIVMGVRTDWKKLRDILPVILTDARKPIPHQYCTPSALLPDYSIVIPGLDGEW